jgi:cytochrome c oxidase assembly protein subunit 15
MNHPGLVRAVAVAAFSLCLGVVVLGAYVRLSNAGLGCPDWPGCYGHLTPVGAAADVRTASAPLAGRPLDVGKAWREMLHRYAAGTLGVLIVGLTAMGIAWRRERIVPPWFVSALLAIVVLQGMLGMLTVTWQLRPLIVSLHLLCGFTTLSLLWWLVMTLWRGPAGAQERARARERPDAQQTRGLRAARRLALLGLVALSLQIALGGWTSSNYAALACPDVPTCQGAWWPHTDFRHAFALHSGAQIDYEGGVLDNPARATIQVTHRVWALVTAVILTLAALFVLRRRSFPGARLPAWLLLAALALQLVIGVSMVLKSFPLWLATSHTAEAALLLLATLAVLRRLSAR